MCPLAVVGLGLRYLRMSFSVMLGHPFKKLLWTALRRVEMGGLHSDWCANLTSLARVQTECVNDASWTPLCIGVLGCVARAKHVANCGGMGCIPAGVIGKVYNSVVGSLNPRKITYRLNSTSHLLSSNITRQPALHSGRMPMRDAIFNSGTICLVSMVGRPGIAMSQI